MAAGFADYDGESIQVEGTLNDYAHRLHLACQGLMLHNVQALHSSLGEVPTQIRSVFENFLVLVQPLHGGYFLVLTLEKDSNLYKAGKHLLQAAEKLNRDL